MAIELKTPMVSQPVAKCGGVGATGQQMLAGSQRAPLRGLISYVLIFTLAFAQPLTRLMLYAAQSSLQSYILLMPFISGYLLYLARERLPRAYHRSVAGTLISVALGVAASAAGIGWRSLSTDDGLILMTIAYISLLSAGGFLFLGSKWMRAAALPISFLGFMVPLPSSVVFWLEDVSANASAEVATAYFNLLGTPLVRHGRLLELPGIALQVAQECSGIHSTVVLMITSLIGSHLFLRTWPAKTALTAFVIPLGILRNGFRILVIGLLCVHIGPQMINSGIHRHGGPLFFALSLVPLFLFLLWLRRQELKNLPG
jgi:exosortase C (VPDSG-CTERM-specific)